MKKQFTLIAWIALIMTLLLSSCQRFEGDAIQKLAYGKDESGRHFVDLGLSVKWATCNIGAETPEQQGLLYAWGETSPKEEYTWDNYKFGPDTALSKYCAKPDVAWHGFTDAKTTLELSDDAAHVNWRGRWRMPTQAEWNELIEKCTWTQTEYMGVKGYDVKASNGNRIFLPAPDENALYASSSLIETRPGEALHLSIFDQYDALTAQYRYRAYSVRAVYGPILPQYCLVNFDANGGEGIMHPQQFSKGALIPLTEVRFTKQASVFSSWNTKADGSGTSYKDKASIITDKSFTIYAQWTPCYTITFDANGGEGTMDSLTIVSGTKKPLPANTFTRSGYVFAAWNTKADGSGTAYKESSEIAPTENLTLYAQWTPCYTITFDANGGEGTMDSLQIVQGEETELPANTFTRDGYVFAGWNTAPDGSGISYKEFSEIEPTQNMTLYAQWTPCYTITFDANGGEGSMSPQRVSIGKEFSISSNAFTRADYTFTGWNTKADGSGTSYVNNQVIILSQDITLYAQWMEGYYESGYEYVDLGLPSGLKWATCNVGTTTPEGYGDYFAWGETEPKTNYDWSTYKYCNGSYSTLTKYNTESSRGTVDNKTTLDLSDDAARANWGGTWRMPTRAEQEELINNCTWTWTTENGVNGYKVTSKTNGNSIFLPAAGVREGALVYNVGSYGFYWSSSLYESDPRSAYSLGFYSGTVDRYNSRYRFLGCAVRAVFSEKDAPSRKFIVVFNANGGSGTMSAQQIMAGVSHPLSANTFTREGYTFVGWNTAPDGSGTSYTDRQEVTLTEDITLYAQWELDRGVENGHDWVDLGLPSGLKWATCNVGATTPEGYGDYFAWGETIPKSNYTWEMYKFRTSGDSYNNVKFNKYNTSSDYGTIDNKTTLDLSDDAARANWGGTWRTPTKTEQDELRINCTWTWTTKNGIKGYKIASKTNGNSIFLPAAGRRRATSVYDVGSSGYYWSSSLDESDPSRAYYFFFNSGGVDWYSYTRYYGHTVRAVFSEKDAPSRKFIVVFNANGGSGTMSAQQIMAGVSHPLSPNTFTRSGYTFVGWNTAPDGSGTSYTDKQVVSLIEDITLYAQWKQRIFYSVTFKANGGIGTMADQVFEAGVSQALVSNAFIQDGYTFIGWNTTPDGSGTSYSDKQIISVTQDLTLYAQWKRGIYTVTFDANGGEGSMPAQTFEGGVSQVIAANTFTRDGYTFVGWNTAADGSGMSYTDQQEFMLTQDLTLYAQWREKVLKGTENGYEWVDLGLPSGLKWATCNVGATTPEGYGDYFAWGETSPKSEYTMSLYKHCEGSPKTLTKYNSNGNFGLIDDKSILELEDDAAHENWGGSWRMPTQAEQKELIDNCTWTWTTQNGISGCRIKSQTNGSSIFLPAAGYRGGTSVYSVGSDGFYWSSSLDEHLYSFFLSFWSYSGSGDPFWGSEQRDHGFSVRAVCP